jgi:tetratricopeptide (TPR) repeat protein
LKAPPGRFSRLPVLVFAVALVLRLLHNQSMLADPLYYNPLGGHLPLLLMAEEIAAGDLVPMEGAFQINSPLYPYLLAGIYALTEPNDFYTVRVVGAVVDALTCALVGLLALRHFGVLAGAAAGLGLALYAPMIFFSADLVSVPFTLLLVTGALVVLDGARPGALPPARSEPPRPWLFWLAAGAMLGLATALRPDLLLLGVVALGLPFLWKVMRPLAAAAALAAGLAVGIAPVTALNAVATGGDFVLLTASGGHNLYIGHNPEAQAQYALPAGLDERDIFTSMHALAEEVEGRSMDPLEVSDYFVGKAWAHAVANPGREASLLVERALAVVNDFEATTYANFYYQKEISAVLPWTLTFGWVFPLALLGMAACLSRPLAHLWLPLVAAASVLMFFFIDRLRIGIMPAIGIFLGAGTLLLWRLVMRAREGGRPAQRALAVAWGVVIAGALLANRPFLIEDTSNEWNKAGIVLKLNGRPTEAEAAFQRALTANPASANAHLNLAVLYREGGRADDAARSQAAADELLARERLAVERYRRALEGIDAPATTPAP